MGFAWSQDGKRISFLSDDPENDPRITIADIDDAGTLTRSLEVKVDPESSSNYDLQFPQWSPDGSQIAFVLRKGTGQSVGIVDSDGSGFRIVVPEGSAP